MLVFLQYVAEAVVENGASGLADMIPGGPFALNVAKSVWQKFRQKRQQEEMRADIQAIAQSSFEAVRTVTAAAAREASRVESPPIELELYQSQIPAAVKQSLKRPEDPSGATVPSAFALNTVDDVLRLLPSRPPRFRDGSALPGRAGWVLDKPLGVGGFGEVWLASLPQMTSLKRAVKFCHGIQVDDLRHEARIINQIMQAGDHPNIVQLIDAQLDGDPPWLMFKYVPGGDLADWARHLRRLSSADRVKQVVGALRQLAGAVGHFHRLSPAVVHRDLKPANILLDKAERRLRITDFGIGALMAGANLAAESRGATTRGERTLSYLRGSHTPLYASPQQKRGEPP